MKKSYIFIIILSLAGISLFAFRKASPTPAPQCAMVKQPGENPPFALIELFTSEGCSSCPPAYDVVKDLVDNGKQNHQKIILLDFHVDYFNSLGWTDSFSKKEFTARQEIYGDLFPVSGIYTPQMIVNGTYEGIGSDKKAASASVERSLKAKPKAEIHISKIEKLANDSIKVQYTGSGIPDGALVSFALVQTSATVKISAGENNGKTLTHYNIVRRFKTIHGSNMQKSILLGGYKMPKGADYSIIAFVQDPVSMAVAAADSMGKE